MIDFKPVTPDRKEELLPYLRHGGTRGCEFSFGNLCMWGSQKAAIVADRLVLFARWGGKCVYPFPVGPGDLKTAVDAILTDAEERDIPCRITGLVGDEGEQLEALYPGMFRFHWSRDSFDYVYEMDALADLKGKKLQKKRNHLNRFRENHPNCTAVELDDANVAAVREFLEDWYAKRLEEDPYAEFDLERRALNLGLKYRKELGMEGLLLLEGDRVLAFTMGSPLSDTVFDVHFEKADPEIDGAYAAVNCEFARCLRDKHPGLEYLDREEDMGLEGLRRAKLSYKPHHLVEKYRACVKENGCGDPLPF